VDYNALLMGAMLGAGLLLIVVGVRVLIDKNLDDAGRKRGFWPLNAGLILAALSIYLFSMAS
jgi:hypothetical protein